MVLKQRQEEEKCLLFYPRRIERERESRHDIIIKKHVQDAKRREEFRNYPPKNTKDWSSQAKPNKIDQNRV